MVYRRGTLDVLGGMMMKYYISYNSKLRTFIIEVTDFEDDDDGEWEVCNPEPQEVRSDGTVKLPSGDSFDLVTAEHTSPDKETCFPVFVVTSIRNPWKKCPSCFTSLLVSDNPLFFMDNGEFCFPCISCEGWIWFAPEPEHWLD